MKLHVHTVNPNLKTGTELSKHIDRIHTDSGLLEGNSKQW